MSNFNNNEYQSLVADIIGDTFYKDISLSGKISFIRKYAEVIIRKILDINPSQAVTLGASNIQNRLERLPNHEFIEMAVETIRGKGNQSIHTQHLAGFAPEDFDKVIDALFDMLSFLLINYFEKYDFGSRNDVLYSFSLLPPIIRYKVLMFLYRKHPNNISVIDKLVLATVKAFSIDEAIEWVEKEKDALVQMGTVTEKAYNEIVEKGGVELAEIIRSSSPANMYLLCRMKISQVGGVINSRGVLYSDFESALPHYKSKGILMGDDLETKEFNDIMNFLYLGRKEKMKEISSETNPYMVINFIS
jgi:hypothetical protein|nr:hypothetical protein [uncultured Acetatifactor sp.]